MSLDDELREAREQIDTNNAEFEKTLNEYREASERRQSAEKELMQDLNSPEGQKLIHDPYALESPQLKLIEYELAAFAILATALFGIILYNGLA